MTIACAYRVAGKKTLYGRHENFHYKMFLFRLRIEHVTLSLVMQNTRAFTSEAVFVSLVESFSERLNIYLSL